MAQEKDATEKPEGGSAPANGSGQTTAAVKEAPRRLEPGMLPPYKVLLHNDDVNAVDHVVMSILKVTNFSLEEAHQKMLEAHNTGVSLLLVTHKERAELYVEQFRTFNLTVTIEPAE
jgi:ATP-dependent Clp protease adaptor protein ClpS